MVLCAMQAISAGLISRTFTSALYYSSQFSQEGFCENVRAICENFKCLFLHKLCPLSQL